jgi:hypothetical protein
MPPLSQLRSDYPLTLTFFKGPYACALKQSSQAGLPSARVIPFSLVVSNWPLVDRALDAKHYSGADGPHCHSVDTRTCTRSHSNFCSSACVPSASESPCALTHARALVREFRLNIDEQLAPLVKLWCASPCGNSRPHSYALTLSSLSPNSALYAIVMVHMPSTSEHHSPITTILCAAFQMRNSRKERTSGLSLSGVPVRGQQGKSDQLRRST